MKYVLCVFGVACTMTLQKWSVVAEMPAHTILDRSLYDTLPPDNDDTCENVCDDIDQLSSNNDVQVIQVESENDGFFDSIIHRIGRFFDDGSKVGRWRNGFLNLFRRNRSNKPRYEINTNVIVPVLSNYSMKAKSLAALIRNESSTYAAISETPDIVKLMFDLSAENIESVASVIDPIVDDMRQQEMIDLSAVSCSLKHILTHIRDETFPNIVSIAEFIYNKSENDDMEEMYVDYVAARTSPTESLAQANSFDSKSNQCRNQGNTLSTSVVMESGISVQARMGSLGTFLAMAALPLVAIVGLIILFPISFIVSFVTLVFSIFAIIIALITKQPLIPQDDDLDCEFGSCSLDALLYVVAVLGLIASPILIPIAIIASIVYFFVALLSPLLRILNPSTIPPSNQSPTNLNNDVLQKLSMVLDASMEHMVDSLKYMYRNEETEDIERTLDCKLTTLSCNNDALTAALPF
jgi:hypothetical protein